MKITKLDQMKKGWFVGDFASAFLRTKALEVACKLYKAGEGETRHVHRVATEVILIAVGRVVVNC